MYIKRTRMFVLLAIIFVVTWSVLNIEKSSYLAGTESDPKYFLKPERSPSIISAYSIDPTKIIEALKVYKKVYYAGAFFHALVAIKK